LQGELAKMIHDADLEDDKFGCVEAVGIDLMLKGLAQLGKGDSEILAREFIVYDALYAECQRRATSTA
jgi:hypothetical protein